MRLPFLRKEADDWRGKRRNKRVTVLLPKDLVDEVDGFAKRHGLKRSDVVRVALAEFLDRSAKEGARQGGEQSL